MKFDGAKMSEALRAVICRMHYLLGVLSANARLHAAKPLSFRSNEEMMIKRETFGNYSMLYFSC